MLYNSSYSRSVIGTVSDRPLSGDRVYPYNVSAKVRTPSSEVLEAHYAQRLGRVSKLTNAGMLVVQLTGASWEWTGQNDMLANYTLPPLLQDQDMKLVIYGMEACIGVKPRRITLTTGPDGESLTPLWSSDSKGGSAGHVHSFFRERRAGRILFIPSGPARGLLIDKSGTPYLKGDQVLLEHTRLFRLRDFSPSQDSLRLPNHLQSWQVAADAMMELVHCQGCDKPHFSS